MSSAEYIDHMGTDLSVVNAARVSFDKHSTAITHKDIGLLNFLAKGMESKAWDRFVQELADTDHSNEEIGAILLHFKRQPQHWAPFAHPHLSMRITTSIFVARQLVKHQIGFAWSEVSRRYVDDAPVFEEIGGWRKRAANVKQGSSAEITKYPPIRIRDHTKALHSFPYEAVQEALGHAYLEAVNPDGQWQVAPEQARMTLPLTLQTSWIWTGSLAAWARMLTQRLDGHAQKETREVAKLIAPTLHDLYPHSYKALIGELKYDE